MFRNYWVVLRLISTHEAGRCPSLSYDSAEETSSSDAFPVNLMVIRPGARHGCSERVTRRAVPHVLDAGASHGARTWRAFASTLTYSTAPASLSPLLLPPWAPPEVRQGLRPLGYHLGLLGSCTSVQVHPSQVPLPPARWPLDDVIW